MKRAFNKLNELRDIIKGKPWFEIAEIASRYLKTLPLGGDALAFQPASQRVVDDLAERTAGALRFRLELDRHVIIESQRRPHAFDAIV